MPMRARRCFRLLGFIALAVWARQPAVAQPYQMFLYFEGAPKHGYLEVPHSAALNPTSAITIEAWVSAEYSPVLDEDCRSIAGKDWTKAWWVGVCNVGGIHTLVSYVKGAAVPLYAGVLPVSGSTHVAVTHDGVKRRHYVNGELVGTLAEPGPLPTSSAPLRIGSDVAWQYTLEGFIDEVRLWRVARTEAQIRSTINVPLATSQPGLVAVWALDGNGIDSVGGHNGSVQGAGITFEPVNTYPDCDGFANKFRHCLHHRFQVAAYFRTGPPGAFEEWAEVVAAPNPGSGLFWFFAPDNWEVMVKVIDACGPYGRWWVFSAATTNVFYRLTVFDVKRGAVKHYFNYPGPPAPAVTDVNAFATCP